MATEKKKKPRPEKYEKPLAVKGTFEDIIKVAVTPKKQPKKD